MKRAIWPPIFLVLLLLFSCSEDNNPNRPPGSTPTVPREGLVAEYLFDGNADDTGGCPCGGITIEGNPAPVDDRLGKANSACYFDGVDDRITATGEHFACGDAVSLSLWFKVPEFEDIFIARALVACSDFAAALLINTPAFYVGSQIVLADTVMLNEWYHMVGTYDGATIKIYINGTLKGETDYSDGLIDVGLPLTFGWLQDYWKETLDDVRIYNRTITDPKEIEALYREGGYTP